MSEMSLEKRGFGNLVKFFGNVALTCNKKPYKNSGVRVLLPPILQKYSFLENFLQPQADFLINLLKTAGFLIGPIFFRAYLGDTLYIL